MSSSSELSSKKLAGDTAVTNSAPLWYPKQAALEDIDNAIAASNEDIMVQERALQDAFADNQSQCGTFPSNKSKPLTPILGLNDDVET